MRPDLTEVLTFMVFAPFQLWGWISDCYHNFVGNQKPLCLPILICRSGCSGSITSATDDFTSISTSTKTWFNGSFDFHGFCSLLLHDGWGRISSAANNFTTLSTHETRFDGSFDFHDFAPWWLRNKEPFSAGQFHNVARIRYRPWRKSWLSRFLLHLNYGVS